MNLFNKNLLKFIYVLWIAQGSRNKSERKHSSCFLK